MDFVHINNTFRNNHLYIMKRQYIVQKTLKNRINNKFKQQYKEYAF
jgi:hypothetical protein